MEKPKVTLKNVKFHQGHEWQGVNADVWINGVKCLHALDDGNGGCLHITNYVYGAKDPEKVKTLIKDLNKYVDSLPLAPMEFNGRTIKDDKGNDKLFKTSLEDYINNLIIDYEKAKDDKKMQNLFKTAIVFGVPNGSGYRYMKFKKPLSEIPKMTLKVHVSKILNEHCTNGETIFNTNLKELGITI